MLKVKIDMLKSCTRLKQQTIFICIMSISASSDNASKYEQNQRGIRSFLTEYLTQRVTCGTNWIDSKSVSIIHDKEDGNQPSGHQTFYAIIRTKRKRTSKTFTKRS